MHEQIKDSGLGRMFAIQAVVNANDPRAEWLGKTVRFKRDSDWAKVGTQKRDYLFEVREVQNDYKGDPCVRVYCLYSPEGYEDTFGCCANIERLEMI